VPFDSGTTNRPGARHAPRALRDASTMIRMVNQATRIAPFHTARAADFGDATVNLTSVEHTLELVAGQFARMRTAGVTPLMLGGDHLMSLPVLRAMAKDGPLGFVHFDAHTDLFDGYFGGQRYTHGTPFRRAVEEGLLDPARMVQIGIRGTTYDGEDRAFAAANGIRIVTIEEFRARGVTDVMAEAKGILGTGPTYLSFDIDGIDPALAPGTGTPEIGGFTPSRRRRCCGFSTASISWRATSSRCRRPSTRRASQPGSARRSCSRSFASPPPPWPAARGARR
jgi:guanidinopropionase